MILLYISGGILVVIGSIVAIKFSNHKNATPCFVGIGIVAVGLCICIAGYIKSESDATEYLYKVQTSGYPVYLNGIEIDLDNVDLSMYKIVISDERQKIFLK